jgi:hypothetical protein
MTIFFGKMNRLLKIVAVVGGFFVALAGPAISDDYSFDVAAFKPKRLETNYKLDLRPGVCLPASTAHIRRVATQSCILTDC